MKKTIIATALASAALVTVPASASPTFYGTLDLSLQQLNHEQDNGTTKTDVKDNFELLSNASFIGFNGEVATGNDSIKGLYQLEYETYIDQEASDQGEEVIDPNTNTSVGQSKTRFRLQNTFLGAEINNVGTVMIGVHYTPVHMIGAPVNIFEDNMYADLSTVVSGESSLENMIMYRSANWGGFSFDLQFAPGEDSGAAGDDDNAGLVSSVSAAFKYGIEKIDLSFALGLDSEVDDTDVVRFVTAYEPDAFFISGLLQTAEPSNTTTGEKETSIILSGGANIGKSWVVKGSLGSSTEKQDGAEDTKELQISIGGDYKMSDNATLYTYLANNQKKQNQAKETRLTIGVGAQYSF